MAFAVLLVAGAIFLAYANGANDNFKGVATLYGSDTLRYRPALAWATASTLAGSVASIFLAQSLVIRFSGKGLVPDAIAASPEFLLAVAIGAGLTVMIATFTGFPISTTHSLTGALAGSGLVAVGSAVNIGVLGTKFALPLLVSPLVAVILAAVVYRTLRALRLHAGITRETVAVVSDGSESTLPDGSVVALADSSRGWPRVRLTQTRTEERYAGSIFGISSQQVLNAAHIMSAGVVSFARGLNDTPKIVAIIIAVQALRIEMGMVFVALAMALGGIVNARRVAVTMSQRITPMNHGQGFAANLVTGILVIFASRWGIPVSTTHVSVGALFGIGASSRSADPRVVSNIVLAWVLTLPVAAVLAGLAYRLLAA